MEHPRDRPCAPPPAHWWRSSGAIMMIGRRTSYWFAFRSLLRQRQTPAEAFLPEKMAERRQHMQRQHHRGDDADDRAGHRLHFGQSCRAATPATDEIGARFTAAICHRGHRK